MTSSLSLIFVAFRERLAKKVKSPSGIDKTLMLIDGGNEDDVFNVMQGNGKPKQGDELNPLPTGRHWEGDFFSWYDYFIRPFFPHPKPMGKIHEQWAEELDSDRRLILLKPRDHYKTTFISSGYATYNLCEQLLFPVLIVSLAKLNTKDVFGTIRINLERNPRILEFYGYLIDDERSKTSESLFLTYHQSVVKDPTLYCATWNSEKVMGTHPKLAILDDIQSQPLSESLMVTAKHLLDTAILPAVGIDGKVILVGTIKGGSAKDDIYLYAQQKMVFSTYMDPAVYEVDEKGQPKYRELEDGGREMIYGMPDMNAIHWHREKVPQKNPDTGEPLVNPRTKKPRLTTEIIIDKIENAEKYRTIYPEVYSLEEIAKKRIELLDKTKDGTGDAKFWSEYFLRPFNPSGAYFHKERLGEIGAQGCPYPSNDAIISKLQQENSGSCLTIDPGGKGKHGTAVSVTATVGGDHYLLDCAVVRAGMDEIALLVAKFIMRYYVKWWGIEGNFLQGQTFGTVIPDKVLEILRTQNKDRLFSNPTIFQTSGAKDVRINTTMTSWLGMGGPISFFVNRHSTDYDQFIQEFTQFPHLNGKNLNHEFDILDTIACADQYIVGQAGFFFWEGESRGDPLHPPIDHYYGGA